jgi:uncharacterized protein (DUF302 family)
MSKRITAQASIMKLRTSLAMAMAAMLLVLGASISVSRPHVAADGIVRVKSAYGVDETIMRLKADVAAKGIMYFTSVDQSRLAAAAGIKLHPSTLLIFGNPPLGTQFITANPNAGLDWPVRLLVTEDESGTVWAVYTDFKWIAHRHGITDRDAQFNKATEVIGSIVSSVGAR